MATSKITYLGELRTEGTHLKSGSKVITDAPVDNKGKGDFFSPTDLVATSLASCMLTLMGIKAAEGNIKINGTTAEVTKVMESSPRKINEIIITFSFPKNHYSDKEKRLLIQTAKTCPVSLSLHPKIKQTLDYVF